MRKYFIISILFIICLLPDLTDAAVWNTKKSTHFVIYYKNAPESFIEQLMDKAEGYYDKIAEGLGFRRYNFWLWENRAKIYIYDDAKSYQASTGQPGWSSGCAISQDKVIHSFPYAEGFFDTILPHEMGHIIFREFVGFDNYAITYWLDEGVASYQESHRRQKAESSVEEAINNGSFINLESLANINPQLMLDRESVNLFYAEALSIVDYLIREFGTEKFVLFCQHLRDKKDLVRAISSTYPFDNLKELDRDWQKYFKNE